MAVTQGVSNNDGVPRVATGHYLDTGTAAAFTLTIGFKPKYVHVFNETDRVDIEWNDTMADAEGYKRVANGTGTLITTLGITPTTHGFTVGLDTDLNVTNKQLSYLAIG